MKGTILVVEDEPKIADLIKDILEEEYYKVVWSKDGFEARNTLAKILPDLVVLDRRLPDTDGIELCKEIKANDRTKHIPVLFLTAKKGIADKVVGLKIGGDDYLTKPFHPEELVARIEALLRRHKGQESQEVLQAGGIIVDLRKHDAYVDNHAITLWPKEFALLAVFLERRNRILSREFLFERVWGYDFAGSNRALDVTVRRLREKLGQYSNNIETVKGFGYRFIEKE